jgi:hypothetical protein
MKKLIFISFLCFSFLARAQESVDEKPLPEEKPVITSESVDDDLFEKPGRFKEVQPNEKYVTPAAPAPAPAAPTRRPAATVTPQRFIDKELNVACYYLAPSDTNTVTMVGNMYAAINCVKLEDADTKAEREQLRAEREADRARKENAERSKEDRENYQDNQKSLEQMRRKSK